MNPFTVVLSVLVLLGVASSARALPVTVAHVDFATCDNLFVPQNVHELGTSGFPLNESISAIASLQPAGACGSMPGQLETVVTMTNGTGIEWDEVWYVADPETTIGNFDGSVNGELAFRIDHMVNDPGGINHALIGESITFDGIFEIGETWDFVIVSYFNTFGLPADLFASVGLVGGLSVGDSISTGSIIATPRPAPEPGGLVLAALCAASVCLRRVRNAA